MKLDEFTTAYIECALWSTNDELDDQGGEPLDANYSEDDLHPDTLSAIVADCKRFQEENAADIANANYKNSHFSGVAMAGHDFWLTRNYHGVGFWNRELGDIGDRLTEASEKFGEVNLYVCDDGAICC